MQPLKLSAVVSLFIALSSAAFADEGIRPSTEGFYPIWESTGFIEKHRELYIGTNGAHYGIKDVAQVGVQPINFMYRSPNAYTKIGLYQQNGWHLSAQVGGYYLLEAATRSYFSPMYSSRLDNPDFSLFLLPITATLTTEVSDWLDLHQTATTLSVWSSGAIPPQATLGYSVVAEMKAKTRHSVLLHAGEVGFWRHDFALLGMSYRYHNTWMEFRLGYFYRLTPDGQQNAPLVGFGILL